MGMAMWWRVTIYIIILGNVYGDETVSAMPKETHTISDLASSSYPTSSRSTVTALTPENDPSPSAYSTQTSIAGDLTTIALSPKEKAISKTNDTDLETSADVSSSETFVFSTESRVSENAPETSSVTVPSSGFSEWVGSSSNVVTVHITTLQPSSALDSSVHSDSITSYQPDSSDVTSVPSLIIFTEEITSLASQTEASSSTFLHTETVTANMQSSATRGSAIGSISSLPQTSASRPLTSSSQPFTSSFQTLTSSSQQLISSSQPFTSSSQPLTSSSRPLTSSSPPFTSSPQKQTTPPLPQTSLISSSLPLTFSSLLLTSSSLPLTSSSLPSNGTPTDVVISTKGSLVTSKELYSSAVSSSPSVESAMAPSSSMSMKSSTAENLLETSLLLETSTRLVMSSVVDNSVSLQNGSGSLFSSIPTKTILQSSIQASTSVLDDSVTTQTDEIPPSTLFSISSGLESYAAPLFSTDHDSQHSIFTSSILQSPTSSSEVSSIAPTQADDSVVNTSPSGTELVSRSTFISTTVSESVTGGTSQHSVVSSASSRTMEFTSAVTSSSSVLLTNTTVRPTHTTGVPHSTEPKLNHTFEMVFQGNCAPLVNDKQLLQAFWNQLQEKLVNELEIPSHLVKADKFACKPLRITFTYISIPISDFKQLCTSLEATVSDIHINVTMFGRLEYYQAVKLNTKSTITADKPPSSGAAGLEELDLIVLIAAGSFCLVLILVGLVICIREYYHRKRTRTFEFANMYQAEDFTLTKIPRPAVTYTEKGVDINTNGHSNGDTNDTEKETLMESIQLRVNSNENGLMVGITGTLERHSASPHPPPSPSPPGSEHLQLVPREEEPLQSQDNPIYFIDDEHSD